MDAVLNKILLLHPSSYLFDQTQYEGCNFPAGKQFGFTAQNVQSVFPELVKQDMMPDLYAPGNERRKIKDAESYLSVNYLGLIPILTKAMQEQQDIIQNQNKKIEALEARLQVIEDKMK